MIGRKRGGKGKRDPDHPVAIFACHALQERHEEETEGGKMFEEATAPTGAPVI